MLISRRESPPDWFFNRVAVKGPGLVFLALYGAWLVGAGVWGAVVERRLMSRRLP